MTSSDTHALVVRPVAVPAQLERAAEYAQASVADATKAAYASDWRSFASYCDERGLPDMPADPLTVARYLSAMADALYTVATINRHRYTIGFFHVSHGYANPIKDPRVVRTWKGIRRTKVATPWRKAALSVDDLRKMVGGLGHRPIDVRNRALILLGFAGAFRRSEVVGLRIGDIEETRDGMRVTLRRSKTDQDGHGHAKAIPYGSSSETCPVRAVRDWLRMRTSAAPTDHDTYLFVGMTRWGRMTKKPLCGNDVAKLVKARCVAAGLDPAKYAGHSLRAGLVTSAARAGKSIHAIMEQTGHASVDMMRRYIRDATMFDADKNAAAGIGL